MELVRSTGADVDYTRADTREELDEKLKRNNTAVDAAYDVSDTTADCFLFVNDQYGQDGVFAERLNRKGKDGTEIMVAAIQAGKEIQKDMPIKVDINEWNVPQESRQQFRFDNVKINLDVSFKDRTFVFKMPPGQITEKT